MYLRSSKTAPGPLELCCIFLCLCGAPAATLVVETMNKGPLKVMENENVTLPCKFSGFDSFVLDIRRVGIRWVRIIPNEEKVIYTFNGATGEHSSDRRGATMPENEIREGNAALHLPQIKFEEEGDYKCEVVVSLSEAEGTVLLEVSAQPTVRLSSKEVEVEIGSEKFVSCYIERFYPKEIKIVWKVFLKGTGKDDVISNQIYNGHPEANPDGTFNVTSILRLQPSLEDHEHVYTCVVGHRSLSSLLELETTLTVKESDTAQGKLLGAICGSILACFLGFLITYFIHHKNLRKVPPKLSLIVAPPHILHQQSLSLTCSINGFKPKPLTITWLKTTHSEQEETLVQYELDKKELNIFSEKYQHTSNENSFDDGTFNILSVLIFSPMVEEDNEVNFFCRIHHHATRKTVHKMLTLFVKAKPELNAIQAVPEIPCTEESLTLSCRIYSFFPKALEVTWYKGDAIMSEMMNNSDVTSGPDGLCSCTSSITFTPRKQDLGKIFKCRVNHDSLVNDKGEMKPKESTWKFQNLICRPKPLAVLCDAVVPEQGKTLTLSCSVEDYYPPDCTVRWFKGFESISNVELEEPWVFEATDLYRRKSQIIIMPTNDDHNAEFSVEVNHCNKILRQTYHMNLKDFPKVSEISCDPLNAVYGAPLVLTCQVSGCDPEDVTFTWFEKEIRIPKEPRKDPPPKANDPPPIANDPTIRLHHLEIIPSALHYNKEFVFEVKHNNLSKAIKKQLYLPLKAQHPLVSDITVTPEEPEVNMNMSMSVKVSHFAPNDIQVKWYKDWMQLPREMFTCSVPHIGEDYLYLSTSTANFSPKQTDNGILIRCEVTHNTTKKVVEKSFKLNLKDLSTNDDKKNGKDSHKQRKNVPFPDLSTNDDKKNGKDSHKQRKNVPFPGSDAKEIQCLSSNPKAGEVVTLRYFFDGGNTSDTFISWSNGMFPIEEDCIENLDTEDGSGCTSTVTFQTDSGDKECEIKCEVTKDYETAEKTYMLKLS